MIKRIDKNKTGYLAMIIGSVNYALYPVIIAIAAFHSFSANMSMSEKFLWGFVLVGIKELFNLFFQILYISIKDTSNVSGFWNKLKEPFISIYRLYKDIFMNKLSNRYGWMIVFAAFLAGPLGYSIQTIGVLSAGSTVGTLLISLLPIFILLFTKMVIRDKKITLVASILAIAVAITVISNGLGQYFVANNANKDGILVGLICGTVTGVLWAAENVIMSYVGRVKKYDHNVVVTIKLSSSAILVPLIMIPIVGLATSGVDTGYSWYALSFTTGEWIGWFFLIGFIMFLARWLYFYSIKNSTSIVSSLTLVIRFAWIPLFSLALYPTIGKTVEVDWAIFAPLAILAWGLTIMLTIHEYKVENGAKYTTNAEAFADIFKRAKF